MEMLDRIEAHIRRHSLISPGGEITCLVSGGADSTCLWHALGALGYRVSALHVNHSLRGDESDRDAAFCRRTFGAEVVAARPARTEAELRDLRYSYLTDRLRATGHTASDQVETILYRLAASGSTRGIKPRREDGIVRPLLTHWREETEAYCRANGLDFRTDSSNPDTLRGLIRDELLPLLRRLHPAAEQNLLRLADERPRLPRAMEETLFGLLASRDGSKSADLGGGVRAVREYDRFSLAQGPVRWGPWTIESDLPGLEVRARLPGDRLAGRSKKLQDVFVDAKVPRADRDAWPVVVRGEEVVAVPGIVEDDDVHATRPSGSSDVAGKGGEPSARRTVHRGTDKRRGRSMQYPPASSAEQSPALHPKGDMLPAASGGGGGRPKQVPRRRALPGGAGDQLRRPGADAGEEREG